MYKKYKEIAEQMGPGTTVEDVKDKISIFINHELFTGIVEK